jgi:hypothetical protein
MNTSSSTVIMGGPNKAGHDGKGKGAAHELAPLGGLGDLGG